MARPDNNAPARGMAPDVRGESGENAHALCAGTIVFSLDGALPVEFLTPGDRIITRSGARVLRRISRDDGGFLLHFDRPEVIYADGFETWAA